MEVSPTRFSESVEKLLEELRLQYGAWNHRPDPIDDSRFLFPKKGIPIVSVNARPLSGKWAAIGTLGRSEDVNVPKASPWWTDHNRTNFAYYCQKQFEYHRSQVIAAARVAGVSAHLLQPLRELGEAHSDFLRTALSESSSDLLRNATVRSAYFKLYPTIERFCEIANELTDSREPSTDNSLPYPNYQRDRLIYESRRAGKTWKEITSLLTSSEWDELTQNAVRKAAETYSRRCNLPQLKRGRPGRRKVSE